MELLLVIAIVAILGGLLLAALSKAKAYSHSAVCKNHLVQMGLALQMYVEEHHSTYPYYRGIQDPSLISAVGVENTGFWSTKLLPYYPLKWTNRTYHCPGYKGAIAGSVVTKHTWSSPEGSYAYNAKGAKAGDWLASNNLTMGLGGRLLKVHPGELPASENQIVAPSEMFAIGESRWQDEGMQAGGADYMICGLLGVNRGYAAFDPARHGKTYNQLFCDGHVSSMSPWILFNPTNTGAMWNFDHQPHPELWPRF